MSDENTGLDYEIVENDGEWQVWTPDNTGGIIGTGKTEAEAIGNALCNMALLGNELLRRRIGATP